MKRNLLAAGFLSLCWLALFAGESSAFFGLLSPYHPSSLWHRHNRYVTHITCRPYNAFTPICWGNLVCDGCNPSPCGVASGCLPMTFGAPPWAGCGLPHMPPMHAYDHSHATDRPAPPPTFTPPAPIPVGPPTMPGTTMAYPYGVSQANYYPMPMYYPTYSMPMYYNPYQPWQPNPYYWYGSSR
ncbi:MAG: hypothetical protein FJ303_09440 [Planctomycetes bacterium]|nr:hypothetical protein [Planctomycetota bacterium]